MHNREDTLFHFTGILSTRWATDLAFISYLKQLDRPKDDHLHTLEIDLDRGGRSHASGEAVRGELSSIVDYEVWLPKVGELLIGGADEHVVHEQGMVCTSAYDADFDAILGIPLRKWTR